MTIRRQVFYSFHHANDVWRAAQIRNIGAVEGNKPTSDNDWEQVKRGGNESIKQWIDSQMQYRSCTIVLVGSETANREWINYEIRESWEKGMGIVGIYIHGLEDSNGYTSSKGRNPFNLLEFHNGKKLSSVVECHNPIGHNSQLKYQWISDNLSSIVEEAIRNRNS